MIKHSQATFFKKEYIGEPVEKDNNVLTVQVEDFFDIGESDSLQDLEVVFKETVNSFLSLVPERKFRLVEKSREASKNFDLNDKSLTLSEVWSEIK